VIWCRGTGRSSIWRESPILKKEEKEKEESVVHKQFPLLTYSKLTIEFISQTFHIHNAE